MVTAGCSPRMMAQKTQVAVISRELTAVPGPVPHVPNDPASRPRSRCPPLLRFPSLLPLPPLPSLPPLSGPPGAPPGTQRHFSHFSTVRTSSYDMDVPFMQLEQHGWDIHAV